MVEAINVPGLILSFPINDRIKVRYGAILVVGEQSAAHALFNAAPQGQKKTERRKSAPFFLFI